MKTLRTLNNALCFSFALALGIAFSSSQAVAQTGTSGEDAGENSILAGSVIGIGANVDVMSGLGVSVRHHLPQNFSYMVTGYAYKTRDVVSYNYGLELQYDVLLKERLRFYALVGGSQFYYDGNPDERGNEYVGPTRFGGGLGLETNLGSAVCFSVSGKLVSFQPVGDLIPFAGLAMHYYLK